ncbi:helix-turn-helix domain-containing protein [Shewanella sp. A14]
MSNQYKVRIDRVIRYIEVNLPNSISLTEVANVSCFSPYHFHRIFTAIMAETVNDYIVRRRLEKAIDLLTFHTELSITQVALNSGFSSNANFSKAVKLYFGFSPSAIRNPSQINNSKIGKIYSKYGKAFNPTDLYPTRIIDGENNQARLVGNNMKIEVKEFESRRVCTLASACGYEPEAIYEVWDTLIQWAISNGIKKINKVGLLLLLIIQRLPPLISVDIMLLSWLSLT